MTNTEGYVLNDCLYMKFRKRQKLQGQKSDEVTRSWEWERRPSTRGAMELSDGNSLHILIVVVVYLLSKLTELYP